MASKHLLAGVALIGLMAQPALAQNQDTTGHQQLAQAGQQQLGEVDMEFATDAAEGGLKEVQLGQLAQQQAESEEVKQFGQRMVEDHGQANEQLMQIAQQKGIELPQELPEDAQQLYEELQQKSGAEFDQAYMDEMVSDHEEDIETFQEYAETGQDPDLTSFAEQTLPVLQEHLELAQQTQKQISAAAGQGEQQAAAMQDQQPSLEGGNQSAAMWGEQPAATQPEQAKVAVSLDQLQLGEDAADMMTAETKEQLEQIPECGEQQYQPYAEPAAASWGSRYF